MPTHTGPPHAQKTVFWHTSGAGRPTDMYSAYAGSCPGAHAKRVQKNELPGAPGDSNFTSQDLA